ncbi:TPA: restriction endonuclease subunit S [Escherichia coli]|nr:restriction endonuclease subunit S [Escherichia coli]HCS5143875.1 restriction endonuclease subunit S [Escherichia coli]
MSELSYLEKLLDGVEVEWKPLKDVCDFKNGFAFKSSLFKETGLPIVRITNIDGFNVDLDEVKYFSLNDYKEDLSSFEVSMGNILIAMSGATTGKVGIYKKGTKCYLNQRVGKFIPKENILNNNYLYHFLLLNTETIYILAGGGAQPNLSSNALMSKLLIPIPCPDNPEKSLAIQSEIVRILDKFTALTAELTAELNMRKKQYNYYRDQLLSFEDGEVEWKALGTICQIGDGNHSSKYPKANEMIEQGIPFIRGTNMVNGTICNQDMKYISKEKHNELKKGHLKAFDVLIANRGEVGKVAYVPEGYSGSNLNSQLAWLRANPEIIINRYLFFILCSSTIQNKLSGEGGALQQLTIKNIKNIQIPVPSITVQSNIVSFLDKFDSLTNSISEGLPREIELRQKQYEYYRDLLFSFPKPDTVSN